MAGIVAIVGRPNVGKSTLFNRITQSRKAIVDEFSGVTRDRHYGKGDWNGKEFSLIDTGGYLESSDNIFDSEIRKQVKLAVEECDVILLVVDLTSGVTDLDESIARMLRRTKKPCFLIVNKVDNSDRMNYVGEFYGLGYSEVFPVSSINGSGTGELLDTLVEHLPEAPPQEESDTPKIAIVGRPNAGKSSLLNALIGEEKNIVTEIAGTTRDSLDVHYNLFGKEMILIDTAGLRKKQKVDENLEFYSVMRAVRSIENSDVCVLLLDASRGMDAQDVNIFRLIERNEKGVVVLLNKWDLVNKENNTHKEWEEKIKQRTAPFTDYPVLTVSVMEKQRIHKAVEEIVATYERKKTRITTSKLNDFFLPLIQRMPPPAHKGKYIKVKYITQLPTSVFTLVFFCNLPQYIKEPYQRFLENKLRAAFDLSGVPIRMYFRKK